MHTYIHTYVCPLCHHMCMCVCVMDYYSLFNCQSMEWLSLVSSLFYCCFPFGNTTGERERERAGGSCRGIRVDIGRLIACPGRFNGFLFGVDFSSFFLAFPISLHLVIYDWHWWPRPCHTLPHIWWQLFVNIDIKYVGYHLIWPLAGLMNAQRGH